MDHVAGIIFMKSFPNQDYTKNSPIFSLTIFIWALTFRSIISLNLYRMLAKHLSHFFFLHRHIQLFQCHLFKWPFLPWHLWQNSTNNKCLRVYFWTFFSVPLISLLFCQHHPVLITVGCSKFLNRYLSHTLFSIFKVVWEILSLCNSM